MSDHVFVGTRVASIESSPALEPISKIILLVDEENYYEAGDDTGRELEITCPFGTQEMANNLLAELGGYSYQPMTATDALMDPAAELGDAITVDGLYTVLATADYTFDSLLSSDISAPGEAEIESEYPYISKQATDTNRKLAQVYSQISKTSEEIMLEVGNELEDMSASIDIQLESITSTVEGQGGAISKIEQSVDSIESTIQGTEGEISEINQSLSSIRTRLSNAEGDITSIEQYVDSIELTVSNGSTSSTIQLTADGTTISSANITMSGLVTYTGLSSGTTTINGACIKTGTIDADRLNLTGAITFGDLSVSVQNDINDAYSMASAAQERANEVEDVVDGWTYHGTTYIDGSSIMTGTVTASTLEGGRIYLLDDSSDRAGQIRLASASSASYSVDFRSEGAMRVSAWGGDLFLENENGNSILLDSSQNCIFFLGRIAPQGDDEFTCGTGSNRWSDIYCVNGSISTSDENDKKDIEPLPAKYLDMLDRVEPYRFRFVDNTSNRYHTGFTAQNVKSAMDAAGVSDLEFAGWIRDYDSAGGEIYMLRYQEFAALMLAKIRQLETKITELEASA